MKSYLDICRKDSDPGYVIDHAVQIVDQTIKDATRRVYERASKCIDELETGKETNVKHVYIGKTYIRRKNGHCPFDRSNTSTWSTEGIHSRYQDHLKSSYGKDGLIVLAVVTRESIPEKCAQDECFTDQEEYVLMLEKRVIEFCWLEDPRVHNASTKPGKTDGAESEAYVVYMSFAMNGKCIVRGRYIYRTHSVIKHNYVLISPNMWCAGACA